MATLFPSLAFQIINELNNNKSNVLTLVGRVRRIIPDNIKCVFDKNNHDYFLATTEEVKTSLLPGKTSLQLPFINRGRARKWEMRDELQKGVKWEMMNKLWEVGEEVFGMWEMSFPHVNDDFRKILSK